MTKIINKNYKNYQQKIQEMNDFTNESALMEADTKKDDEAGLTDEELREIALDIAIDMSKLMEKVSPDDILKISRDVANYIKFHIIGEEYDPERQEEVLEDEKEEIVDNENEYEIMDDEEFTIEDDEEELDEEPESEEETQEDEDDVESLGEQSGVIPDEFII